jgi:primosomal protein N' (replication factor Y) (superfamily II helicase)
MSNPIATVILDDGIDKPLDYVVPEGMAVRPGMRVRVPVGKTVRKGTVHELKAKSLFSRVLPIREVLEEKPLLTDGQFALANWMARYYCTSLRRVLRCFLPAAVRGKAKEKKQLFIKRKMGLKEMAKLCENMRGKHPARTRVLEVMLKKSGILLTELLELAEVSKSPVETLIKEEVLLSQMLQIDRSPLEDHDFFQTQPKTLNDEQKSALEGIISTPKKSYATHLIHGVTGSGKTEVYMQAMEKVRADGKGVIMLVPEIALTTQTTERLRARFGEKIAILHHRLSDGERFDMWHNIHSGRVNIVVGARSAVFSPVQNLGLIIVDEEHDSSYKQSDEMPCYHGRDVAIYRAYLEKVTVVLGSATPSLESYANALSGKYTLHTLNQRATNANLPHVELVNMKHHKGIFSDKLLDGIKKRLDLGEQSLLFLNRRGYHAFQVCGECTKAIECPHCDLSLTYHKGPHTLSCHLCGYSLSPPPTNCPSCKGKTLQYKGFGTELIERTLNAILPDVRTLRMDADTTRHKGSHERLFKQFRAGKADVLIGTQMIAKGFHFPSVTLVGILGSDGALHLPDYKASETVYQLLTQVAGRSGRGALPGEVLIQTYNPTHPLYAHARKEDFKAFFDEEYASRKLFTYPPLSHLAKLTFSGPVATATLAHAQTYHASLQKHLPPAFTLYPISPAFRARIKDRYRYTFLIKGPTAPPIHLPHLPTHYRCLIDIDPTSTL